jgi:hypothetical protein
MSVNRQDTEQRKKLVMTNEQARYTMESRWVEVIISALIGQWHACYVSQDELDTKVITFFFEKADYEEMRDNFANNDLEQLLKEKTVDEQWGIISQKIKSAVEEHVPSNKGKYIKLSMRKENHYEWMKGYF